MDGSISVNFRKNNRLPPRPGRFGFLTEPDLLWAALPPANNDGVVNIADLVEVAQNFGQVGKNNADINGDGIVNIVDLILVAVALGEGAAAPAAHAQALSTLTAKEVAQWLIEAKQL